MSRGLKIIYIPEKNNRVGNKRAETRHRQWSGVHHWSIRTDLGRHGAKENSGDAESDRRRLSEKSNIPQRESRIRLRSCRGVRSTLVSQGILRQSDELSGEPPAIFFSKIIFVEHVPWCCDLLWDFLPLQVYTTQFNVMLMKEIEKAYKI